MASTRSSIVGLRGRAFAVALVALLSLVAWAGDARAELVVTTIERGAWPATVAALQTDLRSEGTVLHVLVSDEGGRRARCGGYVLSFDAVGEAAFGVGACDPRTQATSVVLRHRAALFEHGDLIARPLPVAITAIETRSTSVSGSAASGGGSEVACSVAVRPFLRDMESGAVVHLPPGRFVLRPLASGVTAVVDTDGWNLIGATAGLVIDYEVVDTQRREVVLRDRATLSCGSSPVTPGAPPRVDPACPDAIPLVPGAVVQGDTATASHRLQPRCGGSTANPEQVYALQLPSRSRVSLRLTSAFDGVLSVRSGCDPASPEVACNDDAGDTRHSALDVTLDAGTHFVFVDGWGTSGAGTYSLVATVTSLEASTVVVAVGAPDVSFVAPPPVVAVAPPEPPLRVSTCEQATPLPHDGAVHDETSGYANQRGASCGSGARSPERVYALTLTRRARVRLRLTSTFDGVLYVRSGCSQGAEIACNDDAGDTRHSALDVTLDAGTWFVFVDGYGEHQSGSFDLSCSVDELRSGFDARVSVSYGSSGTSLGLGVGYAATARLRLHLGYAQLGVGARVGIETFSGNVASDPNTIDLSVLTAALPLTFDVPMLDGVLHAYTTVEPAVLFARASSTRASGAVTERNAVGGVSFGAGVEVRLLRWLGVFTEFDYRVASVTMLGPDPLLSSGASYVAGLTSGF
ncbi:MAG: hypothetical protein U0326_44685 [Polyangiales bacterium]